MFIRCFLFPEGMGLWSSEAFWTPEPQLGLHCGPAGKYEPKNQSWTSLSAQTAMPAAWFFFPSLLRIYIYIDIGEASGERRVTRGGVSWSYSACLVGIAEKHASTIACFHSLHCPRHPGPCLSDCLEAPGTLRDDGSAGLFHFSCVVLATSHFSLRKLVGL